MKVLRPDCNHRTARGHRVCNFPGASPLFQVRSRGSPMPEQATLPAVAAHGASRLPAVEVDSYNVELKDDEGFIGDRASKKAFRKIIDNWRKPLRKAGASQRDMSAPSGFRLVV